jgi:alpha-L-arabinofuranosidase
MKKIFLLSFLLASASLNAADEVININFKKSKKVSPVEYGFHYEEIGMIGEGGLYAELVRNRSLEEATPPAGLPVKDGLYQHVVNPTGNNKRVFHVDPLIGWKVTPLSYSPVSIERTQLHPMNEKNPSSMLVGVSHDFDPSQPDVAIHNTGFFGMCFRKENEYRLSFYVRCERYKGEIQFRLSDENGQPVSGALSFQPKENGWQYFTGKLIAAKDVKRGMLSILPTTAGMFQLDVVSLFPANTWDNGKSVFRNDIMQNLADYAPDFIRFPGGCIVHGVNEETMYHWKQTIGDLSQRPGAWSKWAPYYRSDGLGYHEFYELCEYLGADAMYVTPTGMVCTEWTESAGYHQFLQPNNDVNDYVNDAIDAIEYAIGDTTTRWGSERAKNGHPKPFPLKYVEIGNEDFGPVYYKRYDVIASAVKAKYPHLKVICNSIIFADENDKRKYITEFPHPEKIEIFDEHYYRDVDWVKSDHYKFDSYERPSPDLFIGELGIHAKYPKGMLAEGVEKLSLERNGDLHPLMADRPLMRNFDFLQGRPMQPVLLHDASSSIKTFNYYLCKMLRDNKIDIYYDTKITEQSDVFATAGRDPQTGELIVKIINLSDDGKDVTIEGLKGNKQTLETVLTAGQEQINTPLTPYAVSPVREEKKMNFPAQIKLKGNSFVIYRIKNK